MSKKLDERALELKYQFRFRLTDLASVAIERGFPIAGVVLVTYFGVFRPIHDLAGHNTQASFGLAMLADVRPSEIVSYLFGVAGWIFGINAQRLRRNVTERLTGRNAALEQQKDPNRTSSGLTPRGKTPSENEP
jgi:hypothetical protein